MSKELAQGAEVPVSTFSNFCCNGHNLIGYDESRNRCPLCEIIEQRTARQSVSEQAQPDLRKLYDAACRAGLSSTEGRTYEEWHEKVSDYGLDDARQAYYDEQANHKGDKGAYQN